MICYGLPLFQSAPRSPDRGDLFLGILNMPALGFQSAPRSPDRGDFAFNSGMWTQDGFNPRPDHLTGATSLGQLYSVANQVSIRAPIT